MGYVYLLYGAAVTWAMRKQLSISTSTTEAEYVGLCNAAKEAVWLRNLFEDLGRGQYAGGEHAVRIYSDNQGALRLTGNPEFHARSKHIDVQYHYVRKLKEAGVHRGRVYHSLRRRLDIGNNFRVKSDLSV